MRIRYKDLEVGDEVIIPSNSDLKYLKLLSKNTRSFTCSICVGNPHPNGLAFRKDFLEEDISKHDAKYYLQDTGDYVDIWLVKRNKI